MFVVSLNMFFEMLYDLFGFKIDYFKFTREKH